MKRTLLIVTALFITVCCKAQEELSFPFQGGSTIMTRFFKDSLTVSSNIIKKKATGLAVFKFTADESGNIKKIIIYYADDQILVPPLIEALKKSNKKWIIPNHEKLHDFIIPFSVYFNLPADAGEDLLDNFYKFYSQRKPIYTYNQVPLDDATLLPTVMVTYDLP
jgi:hypothetical protein